MKKHEQYVNLTKKLAIMILNLSSSIPVNFKTKKILDQIIRSATSVGANYRSVCRARSDAEFISRLGIVVEEADETLYWLEILEDLKIIKNEQLSDIKTLINHIIGFAISSIKTVKKRIKNNFSNHKLHKEV